MDQYYLLGSPISHSLSPAMMNCAFRTLGIEARYDLLETDEASLPETVEALRSRKAAGWNLTMPVKQAMSRLCDELSLAAEIGGAVNVVKNEHGRLLGFTTDGIGFVGAIRRAGREVTGRKLTLLGTGGAAMAILIQSALEGAAEIAIFANRPSSKEKAGALTDRLRKHTDTRFTICGYEDPALLCRHLKESAILVNATNVGMAGGPRPEGCLIPDPRFFAEGLYVYDIIYHPAVTPLIAMARRAGLEGENGLSMLIGQGEAGFKLWTGRDMPLQEVTDTVQSLFRNA